MLFLLTGDVQIGKTRWLQALVEHLLGADIVCYGVLAPGIWVLASTEETVDQAAAAALSIHGQGVPDGKPPKKTPKKLQEKTPKKSPEKPHPLHNLSANGRCASVGQSAAGAFEKLGIDNLLLPQMERISFAMRADLAREQDLFDENAQASHAGLGWHISDQALNTVNQHLASVATLTANGHDKTKGTDQQEQYRMERKGVLVIDEVGRLELHHDGGLIEAMRLLERGPVPGMEDALVVVRQTLVEEVAQRFADIWDGAMRINPDAVSEDLVLRYLEVTEG